MTKQAPKKLNTHEPNKHPHNKDDIATVKLPAHFPFNDLICIDDHKKLFETIFKGK